MKFKLILNDDKLVLSSHESSKFELLCFYQGRSYYKLYSVLVNDLIDCIKKLSQYEICCLLENKELIKYNVYRVNLYIPELKNIKIDKRVHMNQKAILALRAALVRIE